MREEMKVKKQITKLLILSFFLLTAAIDVKASTKVGLKLQTIVNPSISIEKSSQSRESGTLNVATGIIESPMQSVFTLQTNESDENYDFVITSAVQKNGGTDSAYGLSGTTPTLLFTNTANLPSDSDIINAKQGGTFNRNVIAYPVNVILTNSTMTSQFQQNYRTYGDCFVIKVNGTTGGTIVHNLNQNPVNGTYKIGQDAAGTYSSTVTFTAVSKL